MRNFVLITDTHFCLKSNIRTGDYLDDLTKKLSWVVDYCNEHDAILLHAGDWFDTPSVPDVVKASVIRCLVRCKNGVYAINGNHDELYGSSEHLVKTSFNILVEAGLVSNLANGDVLFDECLLTGTIPVKASDRPVIALFHGLFNVEDGHNTFRFTDVAPHSNELLVCLGHDHICYEPLKSDPHTTIIRPGSFARDERTNEHMRIPNLVHIAVDNGHIDYKMVPILASRAPETIFKTREVTVSDTEKQSTYAEVIAQLGNARKSQMSFREALSQVADPDVFEYCMKLLEDHNREAETKCKNL